MSVLVGSTGFVGSTLHRARPFDVTVHRPDLATITGLETDLLVCAGMPGEKWRANAEPGPDWDNTRGLSGVLATVRAERAVLISTIDVYQPPVGVDERTPPQYDAPDAYGRHRAWFEAFFRATFPGALVLRLPALYAPDLRKNLVHDLLHDRRDQFLGVNPTSEFQFVDARRTWDWVDAGLVAGLAVLNVTSPAITAQEIADQYGERLQGTGAPVRYDVRSQHAGALGGADGYLVERATVLADLAALASLAAR